MTASVPFPSTGLDCHSDRTVIPDMSLHKNSLGVFLGSINISLAPFAIWVSKGIASTSRALES